MNKGIVRGRFAPSPTGLLHIGNARTALAAWWATRRASGRFIYRVEDLDPPRVLAGAEEAALQDLQWLGIDWDEGPDVGGDFGPYRQSERLARYERALDRLAADGHLFPCRVTRRELREIASAPHGSSEQPYPPELRPRELHPEWYGLARNGDDVALRFRVPDEVITITDLVQGGLRQHVATETGDFVLRRRDGLIAYQLAVVLDDIDMQISEVVRGVDILDSVGRQVLLYRALGAPAPAFAHVPLVLNAEGEKLSKRDAGLTLRSLRKAGIHPEQVSGYLAWSMGLIPEPAAVSAHDLVGSFEWNRVSRSPHVVPPDVAERMARL
jgi:glutamyl-tRNA synthetase